MFHDKAVTVTTRIGHSFFADFYSKEFSRFGDSD